MNITEHLPCDLLACRRSKSGCRAFVIHELDQSDLPPTPKLCVAAVLMCCACHILHSLFSDKTCVALLRMMALPPDGESLKFLGNLMKEKDSQ